MIRNIKKAKIIEILKQRGYTRFSDFTKVKSTKGQTKKEIAEGEEE